MNRGALNGASDFLQR